MSSASFPTSAHGGHPEATTPAASSTPTAARHTATSAPSKETALDAPHGAPSSSNGLLDAPAPALLEGPHERNAPGAARLANTSRTQTTPGAGRFAPSPSGDLHLGNLRTAILAWVWARRTGRRFLIRVEDIDRVKPGAADQQLADLAAIGIDWDEPALFQSTRHQAHADAVEYLRDQGLLFECFCSRKDIREAGSAPHVPPGHYPGTCLHLTESERAKNRARFAAEHRQPALRFKPPTSEWTVHDELYGTFTGPVDHFVIQRSGGEPAYNLAVTVDDAFQGIDQVCRADDLLSQAPAQSCLAHVLDLPPVEYVHVPLALSPSGARLAKRDGAVTLSDLRGLGWSSADVVRLIGSSLGVPDAETAGDLLEALDLEALRALPQTPWTVTPTALEPGPDQRL